MSDSTAWKVKLGLNVFKPVREPHIRIRPGMERDTRLKPMALICPAGCYSQQEGKGMLLNVDGCLECGTCRLSCGPDVLEWDYPEGETGVQYRYG